MVMFKLRLVVVGTHFSSYNKQVVAVVLQHAHHIKTSSQPVDTSLFLSSPGGQGVAIILQSPHQCLLLSYTPWWLHLWMDRLWILLWCLQGGWKSVVKFFSSSLFRASCLSLIFSFLAWLCILPFSSIHLFRSSIHPSMVVYDRSDSLSDHAYSFDLRIDLFSPAAWQQSC